MQSGGHHVAEVREGVSAGGYFTLRGEPQFLEAKQQLERDVEHYQERKRASEISRMNMEKSRIGGYAARRLSAHPSRMPSSSPMGSRASLGGGGIASANSSPIVRSAARHVAQETTIIMDDEEVNKLVGEEAKKLSSRNHHKKRPADSVDSLAATHTGSPLEGLLPMATRVLHWRATMRSRVVRRSARRKCPKSTRVALRKRLRSNWQRTLS